MDIAKDEEKLTETEVLETEVTSPEAELLEETARRGRLFAALRHKEYRYLSLGALLSNTGTWVQSIALGWFVLQLTDSAFALGIVNFALGFPTFLLALFAGVAADRYERRSLLIITQTSLMLLAITLGVFVSLGIASIPNIIIISLMAGVASSFGFPAWLALIPELVPKRDLMNAVALNSAQFNVARLIGPAAAGFIINVAGVAAAFYLNAVSFLAVIFAVTLVRVRHVSKRKTDESTWQHFIGGISYSRKNISTGILLILIGMLTIFGLSHTILMPIFARDILNVGPQGLGNLMAAAGLGAVSGALLIASLSHVAKRENLIKIGMLSYALFLLMFAFSESYVVSLIAQVGVGASFLTCVSSINTSLQISIPAEIRGRIMSLFVWAFMGLFPFGSFLMGSVAHVLGSPLAVAGGALILIMVAITLHFRSHLLAETAETVG